MSEAQKGALVALSVVGVLVAMLVVMLIAWV
jgi:hypothetical protein